MNLAYGFVVAVGSFTLLVLGFILLASFLDEALTFSLRQYKEAFVSNSDFWFYFWNSCGLSIPIMLGVVCVGTLGGYSFAKYRFRGDKLWLALYILFMMIPFQVMLAPQYRLVYSIGLKKSELSVILPNAFSSFGAFMIYQYALQIEDSTLEAARIDGAGEWRIFCSIALPQLKNGIAALMLLSLIDTWNLIEQPLVFLEEEYRYPLSVALRMGTEGNFAGCVVFLIPLFLVFLLGKDMLIDGIGKSVVKA